MNLAIKLTCSNHNTVSYISIDNYTPYKKETDIVTKLIPNKPELNELFVFETPQEITQKIQEIQEMQQISG